MSSPDHPFAVANLFFRRVLVATLVALSSLPPLLAQDALAQQEGAPHRSDWCRRSDPVLYESLLRDARENSVRDEASIVCPSPSRAKGRLPRELALPMPCGVFMMFRRVDVPMEHPLDQVLAFFGRQVEKAEETPLRRFSDAAWSAPVAGGFTVTDLADRASAEPRQETDLSKPALDGASDGLSKLQARAFYVGKYETTAPQKKLWELGLLTPGAASHSASDPACAPFEAFMAEKERPKRGARAAGGFSWFDAVSFAKDYSIWLISRDADRVKSGALPDLPWEQGSTGIVRLPTEAEWEFAARGGAEAVKEEDRSIPLPLIRNPGTGALEEPSLSQICARSEDGLALVGSRKPNLIGAYDMLCNADEIVFDLFRATRPDGLHGQSGGYITKGGSSAFQREQNAVGLRYERQFFMPDGRERRLDVGGVRLAIAAPVFTERRDSTQRFSLNGTYNEPLYTALSDGEQALRKDGIGSGSDDRAALGRELQALQETLRDQEIGKAELQRRLGELQNRLGALNTEVNRRTRESIRRTIRAAMVAANLIDRVGRNLFSAQKRLIEVREKYDKKIDTDPRLQPQYWENLIATNQERIDVTYDLYLSLLSELLAEPGDFAESQFQAFRGELGGRDGRVFRENLQRLRAHYQEAQGQRGRITAKMRRSWLFDIDSLRSRRDTQFGGRP